MLESNVRSSELRKISSEGHIPPSLSLIHKSSLVAIKRREILCRRQTHTHKPHLNSHHGWQETAAAEMVIVILGI